MLIYIVYIYKNIYIYVCVCIYMLIIRDSKFELYLLSSEPGKSA